MHFVDILACRLPPCDNSTSVLLNSVPLQASFFYVSLRGKIVYSRNLYSYEFIDILVQTVKKVSANG
jgi:hypothetical protein